MPRPPQASTSSAAGTFPSRRSTPGRKIARASPIDEQVAEVVVDERGRDVAPALIADRAHDRAHVEQRERGRPLDDHHHRGDRDRERSSPRGARRRTCSRSRRGLPHCGRRLRRSRLFSLRGQLVPVALQLRRPLAQPGAAVGALRHVRAHFRAALLADDAQLRWRVHRANIDRGPGPIRRGWPRRARRPAPGCRRLARSIRAGGARRLPASNSPDARELALATQLLGVLGELAEEPHRPSAPPGTSSPAQKSTSTPSIPLTAARTLLSSTSSVGYSTSAFPSSYWALRRCASETVMPPGRWSARPGSAGRRPAPRPCRGWGAGARPTTGRCSPRSPRPHHHLDAAGVHLPGTEVRGDARPGECPVDRVREDIIPVARRAGTASSSTARASAACIAGGRRRRRSPGRRRRPRRGCGCRRSETAPTMYWSSSTIPS